MLSVKGLTIKNYNCTKQQVSNRWGMMWIYKSNYFITFNRIVYPPILATPTNQMRCFPKPQWRKNPLFCWTCSIGTTTCSTISTIFNIIMLNTFLKLLKTAKENIVLIVLNESVCEWVSGAVSQIRDSNYWNFTRENITQRILRAYHIISIFY